MDREYIKKENPLNIKAREYAEKQISDMEFANDYERTCELDNYRCSFLAGAAYALGNQWRDAEKEMPEEFESVLIITNNSNHPLFGRWCGIYWTAKFGKTILRNDDKKYPFNVIAWLPIPEYKPKGE